MPINNKYDYQKICNDLKEFCKLNNKILGMRDLTKHGFPDARWLIKHSPENINTYPDFLISLNLKPKSNISKEMTIKLIHNMKEKLGRNLMYDDFRNPNGYDEISVAVITRFWGTFNNMLKELGFEINQEDMVSRHKDVDSLKEDIVKACKYIEETEGRKNISFEDIDNLDFCLSSQTYAKQFNEELGISLVDFISSIGYIPNKCGVGMIYEFEDGEITTSKYEYITSNYLRNLNYAYNSTYFRNIYYKEFIRHYKGRKDCDYVILTNETTWYVEIAGMMNGYDTSKDDYIKQKYKNDLNEKEEMLQSTNLNYKIIYPKDLNTKPLDEVFSFLSC